MDSLYAAPQAVALPDDCTFCHTIDLPGLGTMLGMWDLRGNETDYRAPEAG